MKQAHVFISGFVQGVGYRAYVRSKARKMGLLGWVRNLTDDRVEAIIQGEKEEVEKLLKLLKRGPFFAKVTDIAVEWQEAKEKFEEFKKLPTV